MSEKTNPAVSQNANFNLKNTEVELIPEAHVAQRADLSIEELEAMRTGRPIPASKNGLEVICGASCEIGAH